MKLATTQCNHESIKLHINKIILRVVHTENKRMVEMLDSTIRS